MALKNTDFTLSKNSYATFDALTLKQYIKDRLNEGGVFTDQNYEGSNMSAIIDIIAYSYHTLLFYLNQTSSETMFSEANIYENINRIVKRIGYDPTGFRTALLSFEATANSNLDQGIYTIKRYSYFNVNGIRYSFIKDVVFSKNTSDNEYLKGLSEENVLYQGTVREYPSQTALGQGFETITLALKDTINNIPINIEHSSISVFVKSNGTIYEYSEVDHIFSATPSANVYKKRVNENGFYELTFGNGVYGKQLQAGDIVYIYYLESEGDKGIISANQLDYNQLNIYSTPQFLTLTSNIYADSNIITPSEIASITFTNPSGSSKPSEKETVDDIKINSPKIFQAQNRIVTSSDIEAYVNKNYSNIVTSVYVVNNNSYIDNVIKYYYDTGLDNPNDDSRYLFNEVNFSTSGQANNVYIFLAPKIKTVDSDNNLFFLSQSQKSEILTGLEKLKMLNMDLIPQDPVYNAIAIGMNKPGNDPALSDRDFTELIIQKSINSRLSSKKIVELVNNIFITYLSSNNVRLGQVVDLNYLQTKILEIEGVKGIKTRRTQDDQSFEVPYINLLSFNPIYPENDIVSTSSSINLPYFKFPFLYDNTIESQIIIEEVNA